MCRALATRAAMHIYIPAPACFCHHSASSAVSSKDRHPAIPLCHNVSQEHLRPRAPDHPRPAHAHLAAPRRQQARIRLRPHGRHPQRQQPTRRRRVQRARQERDSSEDIPQVPRLRLTHSSCRHTLHSRVCSGNYCASGDETGLVRIWDITQVPHPAISTPTL
jgi:hypothetical protein